MLKEIIALATFSSPYHQAWFIGSMLLLLLSCLAVQFGFRQKFQWLAVLHAVVAVEAALWITLRPGESQEVYSVHCIWFNLLLATVHYFLTDSQGVKDAEARSKAAEAERRDEDAQ